MTYYFSLYVHPVVMELLLFKKFSEKHLEEGKQGTSNGFVESHSVGKVRRSLQS